MIIFLICITMQFVTWVCVKILRNQRYCAFDAFQCTHFSLNEYFKNVNGTPLSQCVRRFFFTWLRRNYSFWLAGRTAASEPSAMFNNQCPLASISKWTLFSNRIRPLYVYVSQGYAQITFHSICQTSNNAKANTGGLSWRSMQVRQAVMDVPWQLLR